MASSLMPYTSSASQKVVTVSLRVGVWYVLHGLAHSIEVPAARPVARKDHAMLTGDLGDYTVSVILPYHNRGDTVIDAARSVLDQTHSNLRLYLIDDGSTDDAAPVLAGLRDSRIERVRLDANRGVAAARNVGLGKAHTRLVSFMDSDDLWLPRKLEAQLSFLRDAQASDPTVGVAGCGWQIDGTQSPPKEFSHGPYPRSDVHNRVAGLRTPMLLIDRAVVDREARFDESLPALLDRDYVMACLSNGTKVTIVPEVLALVRRGRADHVANSRRAARAFEMLMRKNTADLAADPDLRAWYSYRAAREYAAHRDVRRTLRHVPSALSRQPARRLAELVLGLTGGSRGLAAARRILPERTRTAG